MGRTKEDQVDDGPREGANSFANFLAVVCDGDLNTEASVELKTLISALRDAQGRDGGKSKGKLSLGLSLSFDGKTLQVNYDLATKKPPRARAAGHCWVSPGGNFTMKNPKQTELFRDVSKRPEMADDGERPMVATDGAVAPRRAEVV